MTFLRSKKRVHTIKNSRGRKKADDSVVEINRSLKKRVFPERIPRSDPNKK